MRLSISATATTALMLLLAEPALAVRCDGRLVREGDPQARVLHFCGEPASIARSTVYRSGLPRARTLPVDATDPRYHAEDQELLIHERSLVEVLVEEWTYNFGPHRLVHVVRFENGVVTDISRHGYGWLD